MSEHSRSKFQRWMASDSAMRVAPLTRWPAARAAIGIQSLGELPAPNENNACSSASTGGPVLSQSGYCCAAARLPWSRSCTKNSRRSVVRRVGVHLGQRDAMCLDIISSGEPTAHLHHSHSVRPPPCAPASSSATTTTALGKTTLADDSGSTTSHPAGAPRQMRRWHVRRPQRAMHRSAMPQDAEGHIG